MSKEKEPARCVARRARRRSSGSSADVNVPPNCGNSI